MERVSDSVWFLVLLIKVAIGVVLVVNIGGL